MGIMDIGLTTQNKYQEISGQAKIDLTNDIIDHMAQHISGSQLLILNKVLDETLNKYEVFIDNKIDVNEDYNEVNKSLKDLFIEAKKIVGLSPKTLIYYSDTIDDLIEWLLSDAVDELEKIKSVGWDFDAWCELVDDGVDDETVWLNRRVY